jgi:hypothetical protein
MAGVRTESVRQGSGLANSIFTAYQRPALAAAAVAAALIASAAGGIRAWRRQAVSAQGAVADALAAIFVLLALSLAIRPAERAGSLNWALAYSVSCASWMAVGAVRWWLARRGRLTCWNATSLPGPRTAAGSLTLRTSKPGLALSIPRSSSTWRVAIKGRRATYEERLSVRCA